MMTLGSLFDGLGGWQLAACRAGIKPVWSSEIEKFPLKLTSIRFPQTKQLGDITKMSAGEIKPVDIITMGSPCQDLSIAGKRKVIDYTAKNAIVVPTNVIQEDGEGNKFVFVAINSNGKTATAKKVLVSTGKSSDNVTEILTGLSANDIIVTEGVNSISEGMKLNF